MKKALTFFFAAILLSIAGQAQTAVKVDKQGNYIAAAKKDTASGKPTGKIYTDTKGNKYPVYISPNGKLYVNRVSKAGNQYKQYLKVN